MTYRRARTPQIRSEPVPNDTLVARALPKARVNCFPTCRLAASPTQQFFDSTINGQYATCNDHRSGFVQRSGRHPVTWYVVCGQRAPTRPNPSKLARRRSIGFRPLGSSNVASQAGRASNARVPLGNYAAPISEQITLASCWNRIAARTTCLRRGEIKLMNPTGGVNRISRLVSAGSAGTQLSQATEDQAEVGR